MKEITKLSFAELLKEPGEVFRQIKNRTTKRIHIGGNSYIVKLHDKMGISEYLLTLLKGKIPVIGAMPEKKAIEKLQKAGVLVPKVIYFKKKGFLWQQQSMIIIEDLGDCYTLEDWINERLIGQKTTHFKKNKYIQQVASIAKKMHQHQIVHRDFYLCHFLMKDDDLTLIDLHRCQTATQKKIIKDLGALLFSTENTLSKTDLCRFILLYQNKPLRRTLLEDHDFWQAVQKRSRILHRRPKKG